MSFIVLAIAKLLFLNAESKYKRLRSIYSTGQHAEYVVELTFSIRHLAIIYPLITQKRSKPYHDNRTKT